MVAKNLGKALTPFSFGKIQKNSNFFRETIADPPFKTVLKIPEIHAMQFYDFYFYSPLVVIYALFSGKILKVTQILQLYKSIEKMGQITG